MYSECLNKNKYDSIQIVEYVLENLCKDTVKELVKIYGKDYLKQTFQAITDTEIFVIKLKNNNEPVGLYGIIPLENNSAGIYLLTTDNLHKGNIITFIKGARKQVKEWQKQYKLIMDNCYKQNKTIKKWLTLLGFQPSVYQNKNFQIYYIGDLSLYQEEI